MTHCYALCQVCWQADACKSDVVRAIWLFFVLTFVFSWSIWAAVAAASGSLTVLHHVAIGVAAAGPSLAGLLCTARVEGRLGVRNLFDSLLRWRVAPRWYVLSLGGPIAVALAAVALHRLVGGDDAQFGLRGSTILLIPPALVVGLFLGPLQEELGWRGFALRRMLERWTSIRASIVLGGVWACWHLPLYVVLPGNEARAPLPAFVVAVVALSFVYTWFWVATNGSLLVAVLLHSATNTAGAVLLRDADSDFGPLVLATVLTVALAAAAAWRLSRADPAAKGRRSTRLTSHSEAASPDPPCA